MSELTGQHELMIRRRLQGGKTSSFTRFDVECLVDTVDVLRVENGRLRGLLGDAAGEGTTSRDGVEVRAIEITGTVSVTRIWARWRIWCHECRKITWYDSGSEAHQAAFDHRCSKRRRRG